MRPDLWLKNKLTGDVVVLMTGTFISQLLPLLISPLLTRMFSPEEFGLFGLYFSITMIISVFITGRYEMAIVLPKNDKDAAHVLGLSLFITTFISGLLLIVVALFKHRVALMLHAEQIENRLFLLPFTMMAIGTYQSFNYWNNRREKYKRLAYSRIARSANTSGMSLLLGVFAPLKSVGLILGDTFGQFISASFLFFRTWKDDKQLIKQVNKQGVKEQALRYIQFPKFNVVSGLFEKLSGQVPVLMLSSFFGSTVTGWFSFSQRIISAPGAIVARAFGDVFRQEANKQFHETGNCTPVFKNTFRKLALLGIIPFLIFYFTAPQLFEWIFGEKWIEAGEYSRIMTIMFYLQFVVSPLSNVFLVAEKQHVDLFIQILLLLFVLIALFCGYNLFNTPRMCILLFTFVYSLKYLFELYLSYKFSKGKNAI